MDKGGATLRMAQVAGNLAISGSDIAEVQNICEGRVKLRQLECFSLNVYSALKQGGKNQFS